MRTLVACALVLAACAGRGAPARTSPRAPRTWTDVALASPALGRTQAVRVLLPEGYAASTTRYPVLYLLHGMYGDHTNWTEHTRLVALTAALQLIVVMPDADDSWYTKGHATWVVDEVVGHIDATYRTIPERRARAIAGLSMGGYGALKLALQHPDRFAFAGSLSGAFDGPRGLEADFPEFSAVLTAAFGPPDGTARRAEDVNLLLAAAVELPAIYLACGTEDRLLASTRAIARLLTTRGAVFERHELPGAHAWPYWDSELPRLLDAVHRAVAKPMN